MDDLLRQEVRFLTTRLGAIVREQCGPKTFQAIETLRQLAKEIRQQPRSELIAAKARTAAKLPRTRAEEVAHAFSLFFHLVNLCEERHRVRRLKSHEAHGTAAPMSLRHTFTQLARRSVKPARAASLLRSMRVEPVLTAHPTEAKRRSVLNHILRIGRAMDELGAEIINSPDAAAGVIDPWIEALWLTDEMRERAVTPRVEIESTLVFLERTIYDLAGQFWEKLEQEWARFAPRRVYTLSQIEYVVDRLTWLYQHRALVKGLKFVEEPPVLRFFFGKLQALDHWGEKLAEAFESDFGQDS